MRGGLIGRAAVAVAVGHRLAMQRRHHVDRDGSGQVVPGVDAGDLSVRQPVAGCLRVGGRGHDEPQPGGAGQRGEPVAVEVGAVPVSGQHGVDRVGQAAGVGRESQGSMRPVTPPAASRRPACPSQVSCSGTYTTSVRSMPIGSIATSTVSPGTR
jgi:hypothetical protein